MHLTQRNTRVRAVHCQTHLFGRQSDVMIHRQPRPQRPTQAKYLNNSFHKSQTKYWVFTKTHIYSTHTARIRHAYSTHTTRIQHAYSTHTDLLRTCSAITNEVSDLSKMQSRRVDSSETNNAECCSVKSTFFASSALSSAKFSMTSVFSCATFVSAAANCFLWKLSVFCFIVHCLAFCFSCATNLDTFRVSLLFGLYVTFIVQQTRHNYQTNTVRTNDLFCTIARFFDNANSAIKLLLCALISQNCVIHTRKLRFLILMVCWLWSSTHTIQSESGDTHSVCLHKHVHYSNAKLSHQSE